MLSTVITTEILPFEAERKDLAEVAREMFNRKMTNVAGGNISVKLTPSESFSYDGVTYSAGHDYLIMTPTFMSEAWFAKLSASQILVVDLETGEKLAGEGRLTREINMHEGAYRANPDINVVYHSHAENSMFWATIGEDMPNVTEITSVNMPLGKIKCLPYREACSTALAEVVHDALVKLGDEAKENIFLLNSHGILITETDLHAATRVLETVEWNADIAYKQAIFKKLGIISSYKSCGKDTDAFLD
ncbi:class II aldolase/adducin family protein [Pediococcus pentosaceus]|uniref:class II aldolase/adducin family protein n=1 Tax=Pediococcus pentosaceus TaxID=1255 RepID=UPI0011080A3A|nr:class II aldolase/adducin family protein [Pediococcus pentosaceus]KAF0423297.1 sugar aldolase [Pediococcus pentosaceus]MBF7103392.1 class II aldolase/adducin family protein [Pediococcus pentosaceus]MBF7136985.1 class II aldolase/adducin family protein [Pediococcus pentosaceus]MCM6793804.1 class II aldolase/adducin family protein [Pediococcus pentosaceus]MCM6809247.1 class II aldolase/adducin family protein [Pediococcus pentosaceus]